MQMSTNLVEDAFLQNQILLNRAVGLEICRRSDVIHLVQMTIIMKQKYSSMNFFNLIRNILSMRKWSQLHNGLRGRCFSTIIRSLHLFGISYTFILISVRKRNNE